MENVVLQVSSAEVNVALVAIVATENAVQKEIRF